MSSNKQQATMTEDVSNAEIPYQPLDLRVVILVNRDSEERTISSSSFQRRTSTFLNAPLLKNVPMPVTVVQPFSLSILKPEYLSNTKSVPTLTSSTPRTGKPVEIVATDSTIQDSKSKVALKCFFRKCGEISLYFRSSSKKIIAPTNGRFQSLISSVKNTVKSLAKAMPLTNFISQIRNSVMSKIKEKRMQNCLKFSLSFIPFKRRKKIKAAAASLPDSETTFVNPMKKPELQRLAGFQFAKPKFYDCSYCDTRFYKLPIYTKHIRRHAEIIRCDTCWKAFSSLLNKRRHQLQCRQRNISQLM